jgi:hypothetical protein
MALDLAALIEVSPCGLVRKVHSIGRFCSLLVAESFWHSTVGAEPSVCTPRTRRAVMGMGVGLFLIAVGAILAFAVNAVTSVANIGMIGVILMIVGGVGVLLDLIIFAPRRRGTVVDDGYAADEVVTTSRRTTVV